MERQEAAGVVVRVQVHWRPRTILDLRSILRICVEWREIELQVAELEEIGEIIIRARDHGRPGGGLHRGGGVVTHVGRSICE